MTTPLRDPRALPRPELNDEHLLLTWSDSWEDRATANGDSSASSNNHKRRATRLSKPIVTGVPRSVSQYPGFYFLCERDVTV